MNVARVTVRAIAQGLCRGRHSAWGLSLIISFLIEYQEADMDSEKLSNPAKQGTREVETARVRTLMRRLLVALKARLDDELRAKQLTSSQWRFLHEVKERPGSSGAQLARACYVTPQSAQAMMAYAVERGWVTRGTHAENHRLVTARLTLEGERLLEYANGVLARLEAEAWAGVSLADLREMNRVMECGLKNLDA
jgi:DNA-binding MarR family transcriptional regulator